MAPHRTPLTGTLVILRVMVARSVRMAGLICVFGNWHGGRSGIIRGEVLHQSCIQFIHNPNLFNNAMHLAVNDFEIWSLTSTGHWRCSVI
ncbi:hypothetical protein Acr_16g0000910 [Actinidia rufa]|uniref:Secreted protein n=1 Tax=Actinidia rufa TaxID=165716 RepID=A0A7J0FYC5_9ERIC|nr:hypothetical protein Acr_16g0000910 [Actinidia rufa]